MLLFPHALKLEKKQLNAFLGNKKQIQNQHHWTDYIVLMYTFFNLKCPFLVYITALVLFLLWYL